MDTFIEQIVKKKKGVAEWVMMIGAPVAAAVVIVAMLPFLSKLPILPALLATGAIYGTYWLVTEQNVEFEYCVTNGDIDIDCIIGKRKRKRIVSVAGRKVEKLIPYDPEADPRKAYQRVVVAAPGVKAPGLWCFSYHSKKNGHTLVIFQPDERVRKALYGGLQRPVQLESDRFFRES